MRWVLIAAGVLSVALLVVLASGWLAFQHIPSWYDPPRVTASDLPRVRSSLPRTYQAFTDAVVGGGRFEFELSSRTLNEWIAARGHLWPDSGEVVPQWFAEPVVAFEEDRIILAGRYERGELRTVVSVHLRLDVREDAIVVRVEKLASGSLKVPRDAVIDVLKERIDALRSRRKSLPDSWRIVTDSLDGVDPVRALEQGVRIENRFYWSNGERHFRLVDVRAGGGRLVLTAESL